MTTFDTPVGRTPEELRKQLHIDWQLPEQLIAAHLSKHFLRKWHTANLLALIKDGCLNYEGTKYQIVWLRGKVEATKQPMCWLSFRKPVGNSVHPVVLVKQAAYSSLSLLTDEGL